MRKTIAAVEAGDGVGGGSGGGITETMGGIIGTYEDGCGVGGVVTGDAALHDARIIVDMDRVREQRLKIVIMIKTMVGQRN